MSEKKYHLLQRETLFQGYFRVDRYHLQTERFDGSLSAPYTREVFDRCRHVAGVLLYDPIEDMIVLVEQFRAGTLAAGEDPWMIEVVLGMVEVGETVEQAARREAHEEAGCEILEMQKIFSFFDSPGGTTEHITLFAARIHAPKNGSLHGLAHENEDIRVHVIPATDAIRMLFNNRFRDSQTIIAMQWFAMHRTELRSRWMVSDVGAPLV